MIIRSDNYALEFHFQRILLLLGWGKNVNPLSVMEIVPFWSKIYIFTAWCVLSLVPRPGVPSGEKRSDEQSQISWAYSPKDQ